MTISHKRDYNYKTPVLPAIRKWLDAKHQSLLAQTESDLEIERINYMYADIPDSFIWSEYLRNPVKVGTKYLGCFSVIRRGFAVADAQLEFTSLASVISYYKIPIVTVNTYTDLVTRLRNQRQLVLYKVKSGSGKYGVMIDDGLPYSQKHQQFITALGGVSFNTAVNYTGERFSVTNPHIGELSISWPGFNSETLELYPIDEIK